MAKNDILYEMNYKRDMQKKQYEVVCKCGWKNTVVNRYNRAICKNCGNYVFLRKQDEFKDKLLKCMKEQK